MKHHISLLAPGFKIGKPFPSFKIMGTRYTCCSYCRRKVTFRSSRILPFRTEDPINPSVFMFCQSHVINVCIGSFRFRHGNRPIAEPEIINSIRAFSNCKKRFSVIPFHTNGKNVFPVKFHCTGIERSVYSKTFHQIRIRTRIKIIFPE